MSLDTAQRMLDAIAANGGQVGNGDPFIAAAGLVDDDVWDLRFTARVRLDPLAEGHVIGVLLPLRLETRYRRPDGRRRPVAAARPRPPRPGRAGRRAAAGERPRGRAGRGVLDPRRRRPDDRGRRRGVRARWPPRSAGRARHTCCAASPSSPTATASSPMASSRRPRIAAASTASRCPTRCSCGAIGAPACRSSAALTPDRGAIAEQANLGDRHGRPAARPGSRAVVDVLRRRRARRPGHGGRAAGRPAARRARRHRPLRPRPPRRCSRRTRATASSASSPR